MSGHKSRRDDLHAIRDCWDRKFEAGWLPESGASGSLTRFVAGHSEEIGLSSLDVGCGRGRNLIALLDRDLDVVGLDLSRTGLAIAKEKLRKRNLRGKLIQGSSSELPFASDSFDFVISMGTIHHNRWGDVSRSFGEVLRVLRPGRYFFFKGRATDDTEHPRRRIPDHGFTAIDTEGSKRGVIQHYFSREEFGELAEEHGFEIVSGPLKKVHARKADRERKRARWQVVFRKKAVGSQHRDR